MQAGLVKIAENPAFRLPALYDLGQEGFGILLKYSLLFELTSQRFREKAVHGNCTWDITATQSGIGRPTQLSIG